MSKYEVPAEYFFALHHVRPRFKNNVEEVLIYIADEIASLDRMLSTAFKDRLNAAIRSFPGNAAQTDKTINNWRTEISSIFGFIEHEEDYAKPGSRAVELSKSQDLVQFFKVFLYNFQYPGAHVKAEYILEMIEQGIRFKPAQFILHLMQDRLEKGEKPYLTKAEACHCIFNDLRCTRDNEAPENTWQRILHNREIKAEYEQKGDVIRYAGDILDYMVLANLLKSYEDGKYYLNTVEMPAILRFVNSTEWFEGYDNMISGRSGDLASIRSCYDSWFRYVNRDMQETDFATDILAFLDPGQDDEDGQPESFVDIDVEGLSTKEIGDMGEALVFGHEKARIKEGEREDLLHLIKRIPTQNAVGYDIQSVELDARKRYIEVKTTISCKPLHFGRIHLTTNEWCVAEGMRKSYYVYRLMLSKTERKLFLLQDPVGKYKSDVISMVPANGADITFDPKTAGEYEELLIWKN